jgi:hypothetical protein
MGRTFEFKNGARATVKAARVFAAGSRLAAQLDFDADRIPGRLFSAIGDRVSLRPSRPGFRIVPVVGAGFRLGAGDEGSPAAGRRLAGPAFGLKPSPCHSKVNEFEAFVFLVVGP